MSTTVLAAIWRDHKPIFERISIKKLADYEQTQTRLRMTNVFTDFSYQRVYKSFYVMGRRSVAWYEFYFGLLEREKRNQSLTFESVLRTTLNETGRVEPSFSSKLVATVRPELPVYDEMVRVNLAIQKPRPFKPADIRFTDALLAYEKIQAFYEVALPSNCFDALRFEFDRRFPDFTHFTDTKKLDIMLWQWRNAETNSDGTE